MPSITHTGVEYPPISESPPRPDEVTVTAKVVGLSADALASGQFDLGLINNGEVIQAVTIEEGSSQWSAAMAKGPAPTDAVERANRLVLREGEAWLGISDLPDGEIAQAVANRREQAAASATENESAPASDSDPDAPPDSGPTGPLFNGQPREEFGLLRQLPDSDMRLWQRWRRGEISSDRLREETQGPVLAQWTEHRHAVRWARDWAIPPGGGGPSNQGDDDGADDSTSDDSVSSSDGSGASRSPGGNTLLLLAALGAAAVGSGVIR